MAPPSKEPSQEPGGSGVGRDVLENEENVFIVQLESIKSVTEKMVKNLIAKTNTEEPNEIRVIQDSVKGGTQKMKRKPEKPKLNWMVKF